MGVVMNQLFVSHVRLCITHMTVYHADSHPHTLMCVCVYVCVRVCAYAHIRP